MDSLRVGDQYRTNPLSTKPGGGEVKVYMKDGKSYIYDKIKKPKNYIKRLKFRDDIIQIDINGVTVWSNIEKIKFWDK